MARDLSPVCRQCRREGLKLFLKGSRCFSEKCAFDRRGYAPGMHRQGKGKKSEYSVQLREKQKVKRIYRLLENQFRVTFGRAEKMKGISGQNLLLLLERRLDNMVYRMGFAASRDEARQLVRHNHILVNGGRVNIPSYLVDVNDVVSVVPKFVSLPCIIDAVKNIKHLPQWLEKEKEGLAFKVVGFPERGDITLPINEQLIVELYSK